MITFEFTFGKGDKSTTRQIKIDPEEITLGFLEDMEQAQETNKWGPIREAFAGLLGLTRDESRQITMGQFKALSVAMQQATNDQTTIPKA